MTTTIHRVNRVTLGVVGALLLLGGAVAILAGTGVFGTDLARERILSGRTDDFVESNPWFWPVIAVGSALLAERALRWLISQFRSNRLRTLEFPAPTRDGPAGRTRLRAEAACDAIEKDIESYLGVSRARARFSGPPAASRLTLLVTIEGRAHPGEIRREVLDEALPRLRAMLGGLAPATELELVIPSKTQRVLR